MRDMIRRRSRLLPVLAAFALPSGVLAGTGATGGDNAASDLEAGTLQEIVVTAEKRESTVQKTPISITAISGEELAARGITNLLQVAEQTPGMSFRSAGPGQTEFEMRGLASSGGAAATVGFYLDDVPLAPPSLGTIGKVAIDPDLFDLERVEVLRGPQGTLYGSGSMGGTIKIVRTPPDLNQVLGTADVTLSGTDGGGFNRGGNLMLNLPIDTGVAAARVVLTDKYVSGFVDRIVLNPFPFPTNDGCAPTVFYGCARGNVLAAPIQHDYHDANWEHLQNARASIRIKPSSNLNIVISGLYQQIDMGAPSQFDVPPGLNGPLAHYQAADYPEPFWDKLKILDANITYDWENVQLTSATAYWTRDMWQVVGQAEAFQSTYSLDEFIADNYNAENDDLRQTSQEVRLASTGSGPFQWILGAFYARLDSQWGQQSFSPELAGFSLGGAAANPLGDVYDSNLQYRLTQTAAFVDLSYEWASHLKLSGGVRAFNFSSDLNSEQSGLFAQSVNATPVYNTAATKDDGFNPRASLSYTPSDNLTLYTTIARGFRPSGINVPLPTQGPNSCLGAFQLLGLNQTPSTYGPDSVWNYEIGEKAKLDDGRLVVDGALYYMRWQDIQLLTPLACGWFITLNGDRARSYGPELEVTARLSKALTLSVNGTYTEAEVTDPGAHTGLAPGAPVLNIPKYSANAALNYTHELSADYEFSVRASATYIGPVQDVAFTFVTLPSYSLYTLRAGLTADRWSIEAFGDNLSNTHAELTANNTSWGVNIPSLTRMSVNQPRTIGVKGSVKF